ncbi:hypothetical protein FQA45_04585 [Glutamicibacter halophytocola]|uniref:Uncharacterized protein n=1 Tax=Glutamicibacter halophytocola TaxID=1933880 RepID=A0ABX5Y7I4_9MICC|nr:hypothetical protein [Glutamicibacter halophytocola]QDY65640.1 hypothetical protein FQA45_04585 [Glutamicibacter halophytocola]
MDRRDDGEIAGYLEPVAEDYSRVLPRNVPGHAISNDREYADSDGLLQERGIKELMQLWTLNRDFGDATSELAILELSTQGIIVANALRTKALKPAERIHVDWPDVEQRLKPAASRARP